jgi:hypothetical protein
LRAGEYQGSKVERRARWLAEVWEREHWSRVGEIIPEFARRGRYELGVQHCVLQGSIYGEDPDAEKQLFCQALKLFEKKRRKAARDKTG